MKAMSQKMADLLDEIRREYPRWLEVLKEERRTAKALAARGLIELHNDEALFVRVGKAGGR